MGEGHPLSFHAVVAEKARRLSAAVKYAIDQVNEHLVVVAPLSGGHWTPLRSFGMSAEVMVQVAAAFEAAGWSVSVGLDPVYFNIEPPKDSGGRPYR